MFALIINKDVMIFDLTKYSGVYDIEDINLDGYIKILYYIDILEYYKNNYINEEITLVERYFDFLFRICVSYLKDLYFV